MRRGLWALVFALLASASHAADPEAGKEIYAKRCAYCHGESGRGDGPAGRLLEPPPTNFADPDYWARADVAKMKDAIRNGRQGTAMMPFAPSLSEEDIDNLLSYLRTFGRGN
ncbi:MAG: hypothetical protein KatS3mg076_0596 [Candidatus Binatia bacterium]|nr:MAG: hypothetical protein KatS3mg076_0596 [Candidatus Binatia bacterium]